MVKQCIKCGKLFEDYLNMYKICPECRDKEEDQLRKVKDYLWENPGTTEGKLTELFDVSHAQIMKWLREERLEVTPTSSIKLTCRRCGSMIRTGKFCEHCLAIINQEMQTLSEELKPKNKFRASVVDRGHANGSERMYFAGSERDRRK